MNALEACGLGKRYRRAWALRDCCLSVPAGRVVALVGPNGAGKTTLLHAAVNLLAPTAGAIRVLGKPPGAPDARGRVAFVAQDKALYDTFTVAELLRLGQRLNPRWDNAFAVRRLSTVGVPVRRRAGRLSGGQQAQVALTLALAKRPDLLLLDEPLANLDPLARVEVMRELMAGVAERDTTVILSTHVLGDLAGPCDWLVLLNQGRVQVSGEVDELIGSHVWLTGPAEAVDALPASAVVVRRGGSPRLAILLVRGSAPPGDPRWAVRPVRLEELVLAYLGAPEISALPGPTLVAPGGEG